MRVICFSNTGNGLGIVDHLMKEGHSVEVSMESSIRKVEEMFNNLHPDIAFFDSEEHIVPAEWVRVRGVKVLGPTKWSNLLDSNSGYNEQLQDAVGFKHAKDTKGIDISVCAWFNGNKFISKFLVFNYPKMMAGDLGADVQSAGYVAYFGDCKLVDKTLETVEKFLRKANHRGCFTVDLTVNEKGLLLSKSVSANSNIPYTNALYENTRKNKGDLVLAMFDPSSQPIESLEPYVCGVMLSVYPYPHAKPTTPLEILGLNSANQKHMWQMDVSKVDEKSVCGGLSGNAGYITARGKTCQEAARRVYRTIANLKIDKIQYRNDISKDVTEKMYRLRELKLV